MFTASRVAFLTNFIPPYRVALYRSLAARVGQLRVLLSTPMEANRQWDVAWADLDVVVQQAWTFANVWKHPQGFREVQYVHFPYDTLFQLYRYRPDVIISGELGLRSLQALLYRKAQPQTRLVLWVEMSEHTERQRGRLRYVLRQLLLRHADAVVAVGTSAARYVARFGGLSARVFVMLGTVDMQPLLSLPLERTPQQSYRLLYVGRLTERKGIELLFDALERFRAKCPDYPLELWLAGTGPLEQQLQQRAMLRALPIRFLGNVPYALLPQVYGQAGILVFPTLGDVWGLVVNEAMAAGLPVLGSVYSQAVTELVDDGVHGWTFRPDHPDEFDTALAQVLSTPLELLEQMRRAVRERIRPVTPEATAAVFVEAITYVLQTHSARP